MVRPTWLCEWPSPEPAVQPDSAAECTAAECVSTAAAPLDTAAAGGGAAPATADACLLAACGQTCLCCHPDCHCKAAQCRHQIIWQEMYKRYRRVGTVVRDRHERLCVLLQISTQH